MRYTYVEAWSVFGIVLPAETQMIELCRRDCFRFVLTRDPDTLLTSVDRGAAIGYLMMTGGIGMEDLDVALSSQIEKIQAERRQKIMNQAVLVVEAQRDIEVPLKERNYREFDKFVVTWDAIDKQEFAKGHRSDVEAIKVALAFECDTPPRFTQLSRGTYLTDAQGKTVYSFSISGMSADMFASRSLAVHAVDQISARYRLLRQDRDMQSVQRLFSEMADYGNDPLKAFLSGWAALEILISKSFKKYEEVFLSPLTEAGQRSTRERFLNRIKEVMKDKYRLSDKFAAVAAVLFPDAPDDEIDGDFHKFSEIKKFRDSIYHGEEFSENDLPVHEISALLRKYLLGYVNASSRNRQSL